MSDELLQRATRALRERHDIPSSSEGEPGMLRLENALTPSFRRTRFRTWSLLVAASLSGVTAWAGMSGRLPTWFRALPHADNVEPQRATPSEPSSAAAHVRALASDEEAVSPLPSSHVEQRPDPSPPTAPVMPLARRVRRALAPTDTTPLPTAVPTEPVPDPDALYRAAHDAHFVRRDPLAALAAWDRYLATAGPNARMTLEARYNRAIALIRLGRNDQAREALEPFARGEYGGYRRDDAARLLEALP